jgi:male germ cell-associated kinase
MDKYEILNTLGDGAFGSVTKAINKETKEVVAIKKMKKKFKNFDECKNLKEKKILEQLKKHENIVKLHEMILVNDTLMFVFEYMESNLLSLMQNKLDITEDQIRGIMYQIICGLAHMHKYGYFHRDLKPENLLVKENKIKIADFGLAKEVRSVPPFTEYVSTRWYRAPECLLRSTHYSSPVDVWALGCIMSELITKKPLFPGLNERDQLGKISNLLGPPSSWQNGLNLARKIDFKFSVNNKLSSSMINDEFIKLHPNSSQEAIDLMREMLRWDPHSRPSAQGLLGHPFFTKNIIKPLITPKKSIESASSNSNGLSERNFLRKQGNLNSNSNLLGLLMNTNLLSNSNSGKNTNNANQQKTTSYENKQDTPDLSKSKYNIVYIMKFLKN